MPDYKTAIHMLDLVRRLEQSPLRRWPINALAEEFDVHRRTMIRWVDALEKEWLNDAQEPYIRREHDQRQAWAVLTDAPSSISSTIYQYAAIYAATQHLGSSPLLQTSSEPIVEQLERNLNTNDSINISRIKQAFYYLSFAPKDYTGADDALDPLIRALLQRRTVQLEYTNSTGLSTTLTLQPWTLVMYRDGLYILARPHEDAPLHPYAVERMGQVTLNKDTFHVPADYDPSTNFQSGFGIWRPESPPVRIRIAFDAHTAATVYNRKWRQQQGEIILAEDGRLILELFVPITPELKSWVLHWGGTAEVLEPPRLRAMVQEQLERALGRYHST